MRRCIPVLVLAAALALPAAVLAQQEEDDGPPPTLRLSFYQCDFSQLEDAMDEVENLVIPVWNELVAEGMVESYGYFIHSWASEWNVGIYTIAPDVASVVAASEAAGERLEERAPDATAFQEACPIHRDGFYVFGPQTEDMEDEADEGAAGGS